MVLFDFINAMFDRNQYATIPDSIKRKHFFMVQRFMSIKFPVEADNLNRLGINQIAVMNFWHMILTKRFSRVPGWMYVKSKKSKNSGEKDKIDKFKPDLIKFYIKGKKMDRRDFLFCKELFPDQLYEELKNLEKIVKDNGIKL